ncbi:rhodanese-like domain-containing protein [Lutibacter sp.]|uniref:rhodanese-like domain-containing protein n=1 Tax=Lutibacter sp. TaxID=1925666 RepID=UPI0034A0ABB0
MKELEKTKRISIASVLFILVVLIGLLTYKRPAHMYAINSKTTLENITTDNYLISLEGIENKEYVLVDTRNEFEFQKGHLTNAINIYAPEILNEENASIFNKLQEENKTIVLYSSNPNDVVAPFMVLYQLGYKNLKIAAINNSYTQNELISKNITVEKSVADINAFINESIKKAAQKPKPKPVVKAPPKKVIPIKKKKKMPVEGGC